MTFAYHSTSVKADAIARCPEGFVIIARRNSLGTMMYHCLKADHSIRDRVIRGFGTAEEKVAVAPTLTEAEINNSGLYSYIKDGRITPESELFLRESEVHFIDNSRVRRGAQYIFDTVRSAFGVDNLYEGDEATLAMYRVMMEVVVESGRIEKTHDPDAVHMTSELAAVVRSNADKKESILSYIRKHEVMARDIDIDHLKEYLRIIHPSVTDGFL